MMKFIKTLIEAISEGTDLVKDLKIRVETSELNERLLTDRVDLLAEELTKMRGVFLHITNAVKAQSKAIIAHDENIESLAVIALEKKEGDRSAERGSHGSDPLALSKPSNKGSNEPN